MADGQSSTSVNFALTGTGKPEMNTWAAAGSDEPANAPTKMADRKQPITERVCRGSALLTVDVALRAMEVPVKAKCLQRD